MTIMKSPATLMIAVAALALMAGHGYTVPQEEEYLVDSTLVWLDEVTDATNAFGKELMLQVVGENRDTNVVISPLSAGMALAMAYNGAADQTREDIATTLYVDSLSENVINNTYLRLLNRMEGSDPEVAISLANSLWLRDGIRVRDDFIARLELFYRAEVDAVDLDEPDAADHINGWVREMTDGKIESAISEPMDPNLVMFLVNSVYFRGLWTFPFDKLRESAPFTTPDGSEITCSMMTLHEKLPHFKTDYLQAVRLPYGNGKFNMIVAMPAPGMNIDTFLEELEIGLLLFTADTAIPSPGYLQLPAFTVNFETDLVEALSAMGMSAAFDELEADFNRIAYEEELYLSEVIQATYIEVDENGTRAASGTSSSVINVGPGSKNEFSMRVDRPFVFVIYEMESHAVLFMGKITHPLSDWPGR